MPAQSRSAALPFTSDDQNVCTAQHLEEKLSNISQDSGVQMYLGKPAREVVHDDGGNERLAETGGQRHQRVVQQRRLDHGQLVRSLRHIQRVNPVPRVVPAHFRWCKMFI